MANHTERDIHYDHYYTCDPDKVAEQLGNESLIDVLSRMMLIRHFEKRGEAAYQQGKIGGFYHSYTGQEAIATAAVEAMGMDNWWVTTYRCHALALLLGVSPDEIMAELYGRATGNARGRGGSMHLYSDRLLGGFGIVGGQIPVAVGAAFTLHYLDIKEEVAICFLGDGALAQGAFHEAVNLASLWDLPCIFVIENNIWGMGTAVERAISVPRLAEDKAPGYNIKGYTFDGTDFLSCYAGFRQLYQEVLENRRPVLVECIAERFRGHSISDPGLYRSKEELEQAKGRDPILLLREQLYQRGILSEQQFKEIDAAQKERVLKAMDYADNSPWPDPATLEQDVFAP